MKALLLLLLFNFAYRIYADCPNGTFPNVEKNKCYFIPKDSENFILAEMNCQEQNGDLASISNAFDNSDLTGINYGWIPLRSSLVVAKCSALHAAMFNAGSAECTRDSFFGTAHKIV